VKRDTQYAPSNTNRDEVKAMSIISKETTVVRSDDLLASTVENELVMISIEQGHYYALDDIGSLIWEILATPTTVAELCAQMQSRFAVAPAECEADVRAFLTELLEKGMVKVVNGGAVETP